MAFDVPLLHCITLTTLKLPIRTEMIDLSQEEEQVIPFKDDETKVSTNT